MPPIAQPLEMTLQEALDRLTLAHGLYDKARRQVESFERLQHAIRERIRDTRFFYSFYGTLTLIEPPFKTGFYDYLDGIYTPESKEAARTQLKDSLHQLGPSPTFQALRDEPERFGELLGDPGGSKRKWAFEAAEQLGQDLEELLVEHRAPDRLSLAEDYLDLENRHLAVARALPEAISELTADRELADTFLLAAVERQASARESLREAAQLTGGYYFAQSHLGHSVGHAVATVLGDSDEPESPHVTEFSRFQSQLQAIDELAEEISQFASWRDALLHQESRAAQELRNERTLIESRSKALESLGRDREAFRSHLSETYRKGSLAEARSALRHHTRAHGRATTAQALDEIPTRFGPLRGAPFSRARREALSAARKASSRLRAFESHRQDLLSLGRRRPPWQLKGLEDGFAEVRRRLARLPELRPYQLRLARAIEAAGGMAKVGSYLSITAISHIDRALSVARSLQGGHER